jgi:hypothetical protein
LADLNRKLAAVVDYIDNRLDDGKGAIDIDNFKPIFKLHHDKKIVDIVADMVDERLDGAKFYYTDKTIQFGNDVALIVADKPFENSTTIQVEIVNRTDAAERDVVNLPATPAELQAAFELIDADGSEERPYRIAAIVSPIKEVVTRLGGRNNLDELNLLANYLRDAEYFQIDNLKTILESGLRNVPQSAAGLINLLHEDNLNAFDVIDAANDEQLGRYWDEECPERFSYAQYGEMVIAKAF